MIEIRPPVEADRQSLIDLTRIAFNPPEAWARFAGPKLRLDRYLCAYEKDRLVGMAAAYELEQWLGGRSVPASGVSVVATVPERRSSRIGPDVVRAIVRAGRERGAAISLLYPSRASVYRRVGYEYAGTLSRYELDVDQLPGGPAPAVEELSAPAPDAELDFEPLRACYRQVAARTNGLVACGDEDWWRLRVTRMGIPGAITRVVCVPGDGGLRGYAAFALETADRMNGYRLVCNHLIAPEAEPMAALLSYFRGFRGLGRRLCWYGPPNEPLAMIAGMGAESLRVSRSVRWMARILDVPAAIEARGCAPVTGEATIAVRDDLFPENRGPFRIVADKGSVRVSREARSTAQEVPIGVLSALYTGHVTANDIVRVGVVDGDDGSLAFLTSLFAGASPWMSDFF